MGECAGGGVGCGHARGAENRRAEPAGLGEGALILKKGGSAVQPHTS